ncbi:MAG: ChbG/HpnK family deacetylase [Oligoflexia bacterium]|nr:ChbG/HpnK family deacetylase [Oligoflexia bacterium]
MSVGRANPTPSPSERLTPRLAGVIVALTYVVWAIILPLYAYKVFLKHDYTDFEVYYRSAARIRDGLWQEVYSLGDGASPFRYAPLTIPLFRPLAHFSYDTAKLIWYFFQYAWFITGLYLIYRVLKFTRARGALAITTLSSLFILRFCLDCFTIGQVSSLLFLFFCASFAAWCFRRPSIASAALAVPTVFKIGPGVIFPLFLKGRPNERIRAILAPLFFLAAWLSGLASWLFLQSASLHASFSEIWKSLWSSWTIAVAKDSEYFDAAHYGSQSIKSFLLRLVHSGALSASSATALYLASAALICGGVFLFWLLRKPCKIQGRAYFYAVGVFPYLWVMPETFKYTLTLLALPVALLLADVNARRNTRLTTFALVFGVATLSLAGKDLVGDTLFFGSQKASIPLLATLILGAAVFRNAFHHSRPSRFAKLLPLLLGDQRPEPWAPEQASHSSFKRCAVSLIVPVPVFAGRELDSRLVAQVVEEAHRLLKTHFQSDSAVEIFLEPYGDRVSTAHPACIELAAAAKKNSWKFAECGPTQLNHSLTLRQAFLRSRGERILILPAHQPCDPAFFIAALRAMEQSRSAPDPIYLVRGNRRHAESRFRIPVRLLRLVYRRHRLGLIFNRIVRTFLPVATTDTHSGMLVLDRNLAEEAFILQSSKDFLFDLEISIVAKTHHQREIDLPVALYLATEKTPSLMLWETLSILLGLPVLAWRYRRGFYDPTRIISRRFTADDWGMSPEVNQGILDLARAGIIHRVSMMARARYLSHQLKELQEIPGLELGLHFDLTFGKARPREVFFAWCGPKRDDRMKQATAQELRRQIDILREAGVQPVYLDGHHHIHLVPGIMDAVASELKSAGIRRVRLPYDPALWLSGLFPLNILSLIARSRLKRNGFESFPCFYPRPAHFRDLGKFRASLALHPEAEIIVHPARRDDFLALGIPDDYRNERVREYRALLMLRSPTSQAQSQAQGTQGLSPC